jgi:hypothetical protein
MYRYLVLVHSGIFHLCDIDKLKMLVRKNGAYICIRVLKSSLRGPGLPDGIFSYQKSQFGYIVNVYI